MVGQSIDYHYHLALCGIGGTMLEVGHKLVIIAAEPLSPYELSLCLCSLR
jgi:hypothetical protein